MGIFSALRKSSAVVVAFGLVVGIPSVATADVSEIVFEIAANNVAGGGAFQVRESEGTWNGDVFTWILEEPVNIMDGQMLIATLETAEVMLQADPQVNLGFSVQASDVNTAFTITSALLSFPTINNAEGRASAAFTVTDTNFTGATLTGIGPNGGAYLAQYNGFVPGGATFAEGIELIEAPQGGSMIGVINVPEIGFLPIADPVDDMSTQINFMLTAHDLASGTSNFEIVPEPSGLLLLLVGLAAVRRR